MQGRRRTGPHRISPCNRRGSASVFVFQKPAEEDRGERRRDQLNRHESKDMRRVDPREGIRKAPRDGDGRVGE